MSPAPSSGGGCTRCHANTVARPFNLLHWCPAQALAVLRAEADWCRATLPDRFPELLPALLTAFFTRIDKPYRQRLAGALASGAGELVAVHHIMNKWKRAMLPGPGLGYSSCCNHGGRPGFQPLPWGKSHFEGAAQVTVWGPRCASHLLHCGGVSFVPSRSRRHAALLHPGPSR